MDPPSGRGTFWSEPRLNRLEIIPSPNDPTEPALVGTEIHFAKVLGQSQHHCISRQLCVVCGGEIKKCLHGRCSG